MFDIAVIPDSVTQAGQMVTVVSGQGIAPLIRGRQQYLNKKQPPALVAKRPERAIVNREVAQYKPLRKEDYSPELAAAVIRKSSPEIRHLEQHLKMSSAKAFSANVDINLNIRSFDEGMLVGWDDMVINRTHPTRVVLGEGPFKVVAGNGLIITAPEDFTRNQTRLIGLEGGSKFILLQDINNGRTIISAHSGYFTEKKKGSA